MPKQGTVPGKNSKGGHSTQKECQSRSYVTKHIRQDVGKSKDRWIRNLRIKQMTIRENETQNHCDVSNEESEDELIGNIWNKILFCVTMMLG